MYIPRTISNSTYKLKSLSKIILINIVTITYSTYIPHLYNCTIFKRTNLFLTLLKINIRYERGFKV